MTGEYDMADKEKPKKKTVRNTYNDILNDCKIGWNFVLVLPKKTENGEKTIDITKEKGVK